MSLQELEAQLEQEQSLFGKLNIMDQILELKKQSGLVSLKPPDSQYECIGCGS